MKKKLLFLDRDGVINRFPGVGGYVTRWEGFEFLPNAIRALALLTKAGYEMVVISNQGCVGKGLVSSEALGEITTRMRDRIRKGGGELGGVFYCEHGPEADCECKKPKLGLFRQALRGRGGVDLESVFFIGDSVMDMEAGRNLGCRTVLVLSGRAVRSDVEEWTFRPDFIKRDLWEAAHWILQEKF
ncbi:MAG: HAD family hydrolase [Candidatus Omnitrophica bacterium]|nr:HAD family hydrolase [Candidatus Omnitrophota bacterium]